MINKIQSILLMLLKHNSCTTYLNNGLNQASIFEQNIAFLSKVKSGDVLEYRTGEETKYFYSGEMGEERGYFFLALGTELYLFKVYKADHCTVDSL